MLKIVIYAAMNRIYSSRDIESACKRDINFMYLLDGAPAPDHSTIARFISIHLSQCAKQIMAQVGTILLELGEISGENIFIDGTKIESVANKYTFVWKKAVSRNMIKLTEKICIFCAECEELYGIKVVYNDQISLRTIKRLRKKLYKLKDDEGILFVHGIGKRKTPLQRSIESLEEYIEKLKEYNHKLYVCGSRNSYSKTDTDATFMRMKEDAMLNGQLKPAYNLQHGVKIEVDESFSLRLVKYYKEAVMVSYHRSLTDSCKNINRIIVFGNVSKQFAKNGRVEKTQPSKWKIAGLFE